MLARCDMLRELLLPFLLEKRRGRVANVLLVLLATTAVRGTLTEI